MLMFVAALLLVPIVEIAVFLNVADWIGAWEAIALLVMVSFLGAWIVKQQGTGAWRRIRLELGVGRVPGAALVDTGLLLAAGVLFLVPGFVTDALALALLVPAVRTLVRTRLARRFRVVAAVHASGASGAARTDVYDVRPPDPHAGEHRPRGTTELEP